MSLRRNALIGFALAFAATAAFSTPSLAEKKQLHEFFFASKVDPADDAPPPGKNAKKLKRTVAQKKGAAAAAVKPKGGKLPGVQSEVRSVAEQPVEAQAQLVSAGNTGELRSTGSQPQKVGFFQALFGVQQSPASPDFLPQTRTLDGVLAKRDARRPFKVKPEYMPQEVDFSGYPVGTVVIDTRSKFLYYVDSFSTARRYGIAVGREGLLFTGKATVGDMQEWPRWIPTADMQKREPRHFGRWKDGMPGGPGNPLGARAIYLFQGKHDTHIRIHGTIEPQSIGHAASNGCFRMINEHVMDLYRRVHMGTPVVVL